MVVAFGRDGSRFSYLPLDCSECNWWARPQLGITTHMNFSFNIWRGVHNTTLQLRVDVTEAGKDDS